jgi:hypothetical protein
MENPTPFDLNAAIRRWQQSIANSPAFKPDNLEELASHLWASVQRLKATGLSEEEAFLAATQRIGERCPLEQEFAKINPVVTWSLPVVSFWTVACIYLLWVVWLLVHSIGYLLYSLERGALRALGGVAGHALRLLTPSNPSFLDSLPRYWDIEWSVVLVVVFILVARLATGSWKGIGAFIGHFEHPIRTGLRLVLFGCVLPFLPALLTGFLTRNGLGQSIAFGCIITAAANFVLVVSMVLLARWGLRNMSPAGGPPHKRAMRYSC